MFSSPIFRQLENALGYSAAKQKVIAQNIANVDTPNYKAKTVSFKNEFEHQLQATRTNSKHIPFSTESHQSYSIHEQSKSSFLHNGNNVDMDKQMAEMAKNQIYYQTAVQRLNGKFSSLKMVLRGGK